MYILDGLEKVQPILNSYYINKISISISKTLRVFDFFKYTA